MVALNNPVRTNTVTLDDARRVIAAAEQKAIAIGQPMNIAVTDSGGNLVSHARMDGAWIGSIDISINKAHTARAFDLSTKDLATHSQPGGQFFGIHASNNGQTMIFAGGIPLKRGDLIIGAVGVSGGSGEQDQSVAEAGAGALSTIERIFHCNINCTNLERSLEFYQMIGFKVVADFKDGMCSAAMAKAFNLPNAQLRGVHLVLEDSVNAPRIDLVEFQNPKTEGKPYSHLNNTGLARICLFTKNINQAYQDLKYRGVNFFSEPQKLPGTEVTIVCFTDPDGTVLELLEGDF